MAKGVLIIGESGVGKSTAIGSLNPKETFIINVAGKSLPFKGWKKLYTPFNSKDLTGNFISTANIEHVSAVMDIVSSKLPNIKNIVIDDSSYIASFEFMSRASEKSYDKFNDIAKGLFILYTKFRELRDDLMVFYLAHPEISENIDGNEHIKTKTIGKEICRFPFNCWNNLRALKLNRRDEISSNVNA